MMNNKSQIGTTLTWFVAFLIIFFIVILFISGTLVLSGRKEENEISPGEMGVDKLNAQRKLIRFLNSEVEGGKIKSLIEEWGVNKEEQLKKKIRSDLKEIIEIKNNHYILYIILDSVEKTKDSIKENSEQDPRAGMYADDYISKGEIEISNIKEYSDPRVSWGPKKLKKELLKEAVEIKMPLEDDLIKIKFILDD